MDVTKSEVRISNNEKEGEVSSTCSDSLPARSLSNNDTETGADGITPSSVIQEEIHSDSPDTSGASSGQNGGEILVRVDTEESELSRDTEHIATVQSQNTDAVEQEKLGAVSAEMFQHLSGESVELLNISEDSEIVLLDENVLISTTSESTTFLMSYEKQEEVKGAEMSTIHDPGFQLEIPQPVSVSSARVSENVEPMDISSDETKICVWKNPDSTTVENAEGSNNGNGNISFIEEEVSTTEEDAGNFVSTSSAMTPVIENVLDTSGDSTSLPITTKAVYVCGLSVQEDVQDMQTSQSHAVSHVITETAPQNSGISTTSMKDSSQQRRQWDQVKPAAEIGPVKQTSSESQASDPVRQMLSPFPRPSTSRQESYVTVPEQSVCTSKKLIEDSNLSNPIQDCVSSSKDIEIVNKVSAPTNVFSRHEESNVDTTTKVNTTPLLSSALDLIKSNYCSPFDEDIPSPGSSTYEEQKYVHDWTHQIGDCSTSNSSSNEQLRTFTKDETSSLASLNHQEKIIAESNTSSENFEGRISENELKGATKISVILRGPHKESKKSRETLLFENAAASSVAELDHQLPGVPVKQSQIVLSTPSMETMLKDHTVLYTSSAGQTVPSFGRPSVSLRTSLLGDLTGVVTVNNRTSGTDSKALVTAERNSDVVSTTVTEETERQSDSSVITNILTVKKESSDVTEVSARKEPSCVTELETTSKQPFSVVTETVQTAQKSSVYTNSMASKKESSVPAEASARTESVTEAPATRTECSVLTEVPIGKENNIPAEKKDIETSLKGMETLHPVSEVQREQGVLADGLKVSTVGEETSVLGMKLIVLGEETSLAVKLPVKEKVMSYSATITPGEEMYISSVHEKMAAVGVEDAADQERASVKGSLAAGMKDPLSFIEASDPGVHIPRKESKMSVKGTQVKEKETSGINKKLPEETLDIGIPAPALEEEIKIASETRKVSIVTNIQETSRIPDSEGRSEFVHVSSEEREIIISDTQISHKEVISYIHPQGPERDTHISGLQEQVKEKESSTTRGKHTSVTAVQLPVLRKDTHTADTHTQKKDEVSAGRQKVLEKDTGNVMEALEANTAAADVLSPRNKDKEIIRKRLAEVIAKQKIPTDSYSFVAGTPSVKMHAVVNKDFPTVAENLAAAMKETIKKAISKIPEKSDLETVAPKQLLAAGISALEGKVVLTPESASLTSLSTASTPELNKQADITTVEGLSKITNDCTDEGNLTSVTKNPSGSVEFSVQTEDPLHRLGTLSTKEAIPNTATAVRLGIKETLPTKPADFKDDSIVAEQLVLSRDKDKKEEKVTRENIIVKGNRESSMEETQTLTESLGAVNNKHLSESSGAVASEQLKSSVSPPKKQRVKLVRPVLSKSRETEKPAYSLSVTPRAVTKSESLNSPTFKETAGMAVSVSQTEGKETKMPVSMTFEKYDEILHAISSTGEADLPYKGFEDSEFPTATEPRELEVLSKTLAEKVENPELSSLSAKSELKSTELLKDKTSKVSTLTCPGEIKKLWFSSKGGEKTNNFSAEMIQSDAPISLQLQDVTVPELLESSVTETTEKLGLASKAASEEHPRLVAHGEESDFASKEIQQLHVERSSSHSKMMQSSVSAVATSEECKYSAMQTVAEPDTGENLGQPELLPQKDSDMLEKSKPSSSFKLQDVLEKKHAVSETVKQPKLIWSLKSPSRDVPEVETVSGSEVNETKLSTKEAIQKEVVEEVVIKQHKEEGLLCMGECTELFIERKGLEKMLSNVKTKAVVKSSDQNTLTSTNKMLGDLESDVQKLDESNRHTKPASSETVNPMSESDKEKCRVNLKMELNTEGLHGIAAAPRTGTYEIAIPHSTSVDIPKGEGLIFAAQSREPKEDIFHSDIIEEPVSNPSNSKLEQREVIADNRNVESVSEELVSEKTFFIHKQSQHFLQAHPMVSSTDDLKSNLVELKPACSENFPLQSQFKSEAQKLNPGNVLCSAVEKEAVVQVCLFKDTESTNESLLSGQSGTSSIIKKSPFDVRSGLNPGCATNTAKVTLMLDTHASKQYDRAIKSELVDAITVKNIASEGKTDETLVQDKVSLKDSKKEEKVDHELKLQEPSAEKKSAVSTATSSKVGALKSLDVKELISTREQKSGQVMKQDKIILKIAKDMAPSKESSSSTVKDTELEPNFQNSENILKLTTANTEVISNLETAVESGLVLPDSSLVSREHAKLEKLTLKPNKAPCSESFTKDGTSLKSSCTSAVSSNIEHSEMDISPKHENGNMKLKRDLSLFLSCKGTCTVDNTEISHKIENADEIAKVEKLTLKLKKDVSKPEDIQTEYVEEPKLEKITLKFKLDPAHRDVRFASTSTVMSNAGEIITQSPGVEQVETVASPASHDESKPQKITLKLKKDGAKQETIAVTSTGDTHLKTSVAPVQSAEIKLPETQLCVLKEEAPDDKVTQKLKKVVSKSDAFVSPSKDNINQEITIIPVKLKDGKIQEKTTSPGSKEKPAVEKFTLKLRKDSTSAATSKEDIHPETTVTRVKASEAKRSNENISVGSRTEPLVEKITLKLKKDTTKPETVHPETTVTQGKSTEQPKPEAHVSFSSKEDPLVEKITLKLKKEGAKPETMITSSKIISTEETNVVPINLTDIRQKHIDENVSLTKESTLVEKITLKIKKDPTKQEVTPTPSKHGHTKLSKGSTPVTQEEPKLEKLTLKLKKDSIKSALVSEKEVEPPKQPDLVTKLDVVPKEENRVEKLTLKLKKDLAMTEISTGKKVPEQEYDLLGIQNTEQSVVASSREEGKVEKLTLKFKKSELPEGDLEITSTQAEDVKCVDSAATSVAKEGKVEKITLKLRKDLTKSEEPSFSCPKEVVDRDGASDHQISGDQEKKLSEETSSEAGKQKKITLTLKKDAAWSVKRKKIKPEDTGESSKQTGGSSKQTGGTEMDRLNIQGEHHTEPPLKRAKMEEEMAVCEKLDTHVTSSMETPVMISEVSKDLPSEPGESGNSMEMIDNFETEQKITHRAQKDFTRRETLGSRRPAEECPPKKMRLEHDMKSSSESEYRMSKSQQQDLISQHNQEVSSSQVLHSESENKMVSQGETFVQTPVEGKLREILSKMGPGTSTIRSGDLSISLATCEILSSVKSPEMSDTSIISCQNETVGVNVSNSTGSEGMHISVTNAMLQSANTSEHFSALLVRKESSSQDVMIIEEENQPSSSVCLNNEKIVGDGMAVPKYCMERVGTEKSSQVKSVETEVMKMEPKKGRGRPRKTALVPSVIPVVEPPEQILRPKRMCRGRERPPVVVKVRKPRVGKAPGRKKKIVEEVKPATELPDPAEVSAVTTENFSTSATTVDSLSFSPIVDQPTTAVVTKPLSTLIPADERSLTTAIELHTSSASDERTVKASYAAEQLSSTALTEARPVAVIAETSAEANCLAGPVHVLSTSVISAGSPSPCHVQMFEEETRMSAESVSRSQTPAHTLPLAGGTDGLGEESQGSAVSTATTESMKKKGRMEVGDGESKEFTVEQVIEYQWPLEKGGESLMIQEQISEYLGVKSFKRKYPDLKRRVVEAEEKTYLREKGLVTEAMCDLGLTAVNSSEILDIMYSDFQDKYEEYRRFMRERQAKEFTTKQKAISSATSVEKSKLDYKDKAIRSAATWNSTFNRSRRDHRRCCFDLQSFTIHYPRNRLAKTLPKEPTKPGPYPLALIPGQYTDFYKSYTPTELRYFPLSTVVYGPMKPNERQEPGAGSDGSQSDSDDSSSFDDSSSTSSEETQDTEETCSTTGDADPENNQDQRNQESGDKDCDKDQTNSVKVKEEKKDKECDGAVCKVCSGDHTKNKDGQSEVLIHCAQCTSSGHPSCLDLTLDMVPHIRRYDWQCTDCKTCIQCKDPADEDKMLFCDMCDRGYHIYCVGLRRVPSGRWHCKECAVCGSCGTQEPGGNNPDTPNAQWQHEYKKGEKGTRVYAQTLCVPCSKLWRKGRYCQLCWRCYGNKPDEEDGLINCSVCDKWMHAECCSAIGGSEVDRTSNFLCEICQEKGQARSPAMKIIPRSILKV